MATRKAFASLALAALALAGLAAACSPQPEAGPPPNPTQTPGDRPRPSATPPPTPGPAAQALTLTDGLGRTVTLEAPAQRVISLAPSNTEVLFAVGAGPQLVARDEFSNYPDEALSLPSIGGSFGDYNLETIVDFAPDLVLAAEINPPELVTSLEDLGLTVFMLPNPVELDDLYANLVTVGQLTGHTTEAESLAASLASRVAGLLAQAAGLPSSPTIFYELDSSDPSAPWTSGPGTFIDTLITLAGGRNIAAGLESAYAQLSVEELVAQDPDIILLGDSIWGVTPEEVAQRPGWDELTAVQSGRVYPFNDDLVSRPGPRLVEGLADLVKILTAAQSQ